MYQYCQFVCILHKHPSNYFCPGLEKTIAISATTPTTFTKIRTSQSLTPFRTDQN